MTTPTVDELELSWPAPEPALPDEVPAREVPPEFASYAMGGGHVVCTTLGDVEATARLNAEYPEAVWRVSPAETFKRGAPNGGPCEEFPGTHRHLLFELA